MPPFLRDSLRLPKVLEQGAATIGRDPRQQSDCDRLGFAIALGSWVAVRPEVGLCWHFCGDFSGIDRWACSQMVRHEDSPFRNESAARPVSVHRLLRDESSNDQTMLARMATTRTRQTWVSASPCRRTHLLANTISRATCHAGMLPFGNIRPFYRVVRVLLETPVLTVGRK